MNQILIVDGDAERAQWLEDSVSGLGAARVVDDTEVLAAAGSRTVIALGDVPSRDELAARLAGAIIIYMDDRPAAQVPDGVAYALGRFDPTDVRLLFASLLAGRPEAPVARARSLESEVQARRIQRIIELTRSLAGQTDPTAVEASCTAAIRELADADRAYCLYFDAEQGAMWSAGVAAREGDDERRAVHGIAGFCARTGAIVSAERAGGDPRYRSAVDDPGGSGDDRLLVGPVRSGDDVHAVFIAVRRASRPAFGDLERAQLAELAAQSGPFLSQLSLHLEAEALIEARAEDGLFRREAVERYAGAGRYGDVVRVSPNWVSWSYWVIVALIVAAVGYAAIGTVDEYSAGPAVIRVAGRAEITANIDATLASVHVEPGQRVAAGQVLARFHSVEQTKEVDRLEHEFALQLRNRMLDPGDEAATASVKSLRIELDRAQARLDERVVRAPLDGVVSDVRPRPGQRLGPGDTILALVNQDSELDVVALMPGADRPELRAGMTLRLELPGYPYAYQTLTIDRVGTEVVGPSEARRVLGQQLADAVAISGSVVVVHGHLRSREFEAGGRRYRFHDGMQARAEVRVRSRTILATLIPGLEDM
ncbi:MAG TPA: HlyD family efflux transporter periplasmic adaptor subunit [Kofleriaceae bacterium]|nr:HlyD family efflux transporter periplasmic adaptor subunit [Kofleriaceae bacterium]